MVKNRLLESAVDWSVGWMDVRIIGLSEGRSDRLYYKTKHQQQ